MIRIPILRPGSREAFPRIDQALHEPNGLLAAGGDLSPTRLLEAYRHGIFPWFSPGEPILWWSPDPRMVFATDAVHQSRRLNRWLRQCPWTIDADREFRAVMISCAAPRPGQTGTWITASMLDAYCLLHEMGHAHSIEVYEADRLIGGLYGVAVGQMFFAESMFSHATNASKVALMALAATLRRWGWPLIDAQVSSDHLRTLGAIELPRQAFAAHVARLTARAGATGSWTGCLALERAAELAGQPAAR
ncbi:leucyl/phenylalanyl-tRNA--protein transferase [Tahibacter amnicola]|uniref:Leucyl/phenylalanyl-tRNA--protein transferase n=1 Tax=Tahibacter amnicola TaxID=2976241 RepID=A0ABY6BJI7_9GAMM|nr:leucyl/phenylalanyl-tRNA--protein transferase [Tahibacter amnicola]UXI70020.1 leucyl/phenylalanyl-tRNA--protein transferase [Tahibacter amnicola]